MAYGYRRFGPWVWYILVGMCGGEGCSSHSNENNREREARVGGPHNPFKCTPQWSNLQLPCPPSTAFTPPQSATQACSILGIFMAQMMILGILIKNSFSFGFWFWRLEGPRAGCPHLLSIWVGAYCYTMAGDIKWQGRVCWRERENLMTKPLW